MLVCLDCSWRIIVPQPKLIVLPISYLQAEMFSSHKSLTRSTSGAKPPTSFGRCCGSAFFSAHFYD